MCDDDPGHEVDLTLTSSLRDLTMVWRGDLAWSDAVGSGRLAVDGPEGLRQHGQGEDGDQRGGPAPTRTAGVPGHPATLSQTNRHV